MGSRTGVQQILKARAAGRAPPVYGRLGRGIEVDGVLYASILAAATAYGVPRSTIRSRARRNGISEERALRIIIVERGAVLRDG